MIISAFHGELGHKLRYHVPWAYALGPGHTVEIEAGDEALYPLADSYKIVPRALDDTRRTPLRTKGREVFFTPAPHVPQGIRADVVICPRSRNYGSSKNWPHWKALESIPGVFAAGAPDSSADVDCPRAWDYARFLDASIEAMRSACLVIATANGLSVLAMLCGVPLLLITHRGLVAPGPVLSAEGLILKTSYGPIPFDRFYRPTNHRGVPIHMVDAWEDPGLVIQRATELLRVAA